MDINFKELRVSLGLESHIETEVVPVIEQSDNHDPVIIEQEVEAIEEDLVNLQEASLQFDNVENDVETLQQLHDTLASNIIDPENLSAESFKLTNVALESVMRRYNLDNSVYQVSQESEDKFTVSLEKVSDIKNSLMKMLAGLFRKIGEFFSNVVAKWSDVVKRRKEQLSKVTLSESADKSKVEKALEAIRAMGTDTVSQEVFNVSKALKAGWNLRGKIDQINDSAEAVNDIANLSKEEASNPLNIAKLPSVRKLIQQELVEYVNDNIYLTDTGKSLLTDAAQAIIAEDVKEVTAALTGAVKNYSKGRIEEILKRYAESEEDISSSDIVAIRRTMDIVAKQLEKATDEDSNSTQAVAMRELSKVAKQSMASTKVILGHSAKMSGKLLQVAGILK